MLCTPKMKSLLRGIRYHDLGAGAHVRDLTHFTENLKPPYDTLKRMCAKGLVLRQDYEQDFYHDKETRYFLTAEGGKELEKCLKKNTAE